MPHSNGRRPRFIKMTDHRPAAPASSTVAIGTGATFTEALELAISGKIVPGKALVLPSSLRRTDQVAPVVRDYLRQANVVSYLDLPANPIAELTRLGSMAAGGSWTNVSIAPQDAASRSIRLPERLLCGIPLWTVTDIDAVSGRGPFVLDLLARYVHPMSRLRQLASRRRTDAVVDVNLAVRSSMSVVGKSFRNFMIVGATSDPVAAELFALALSDEDLPIDCAAIGPWEDRVIQRATELELGVRLPRDLHLFLAGAATLTAQEAVERVSNRIGVSPM